MPVHDSRIVFFVLLLFNRTESFRLHPFGDLSLALGVHDQLGGTDGFRSWLGGQYDLLQLFAGLVALG